MEVDLLIHQALAAATTVGGSTSLNHLLLRQKTIHLFIKQLESSKDEGLETRQA